MLFSSSSRYGIIGVKSTPAIMPASFSFFKASSLRSGGGEKGSSNESRFLSKVVTVKEMAHQEFVDISDRISASLSTRSDLVPM